MIIIENRNGDEAYNYGGYHTKQIRNAHWSYLESVIFSDT